MSDRARLPIFPTAKPAEPRPSVGVPTAAPHDDRGVSHFPELAARAPTHNESELLSGEPIKMASSNVMEIWFNGSPDAGPRGTGRLFVKFLDGSLYCYEAVPLSVAVGFIETDSPGRYIWNKLRDVYSHRLLSKGGGGRRPPQVVRLINRTP